MQEERDAARASAAEADRLRQRLDAVHAALDTSG
jgi:hypothetical protein